MVEIIGKLCVGIWMYWCKIYCIYLSEVVLECKGIVTVSITLSFIIILIVMYFLSRAYPSYTMFSIISL
jgi:hypothetical protein